MKCPNCGYFNLPGATACGQCRRALGAGSTPSTGAAVPLEEIYPPRTSKRSAGAQLEANSPNARRAKRFARDDWDRTKVDVAQRRLNFQLGWQTFKDSVLWFFNAENLRQLAQWNLAPMLSIIPGVGQVLQKRFVMAGVLLALFAPLVCAVVYIYSRDWNVNGAGLTVAFTPFVAMMLTLILNGIIFAFCALVWFSVWDAAMVSYPPAPRGDVLSNRYRGLRLAFGSAMYAATMLVAFFGILNF